ncbi:MAG: cytochrome b/b6 domain-containing protein [Gemmatimonadota bacterium]|nr:MAG: cytochrome b/b6 domain-containing protein [Gemmatimonadota bacterium]
MPNADQLVVDPEELAGSVHGALGISCVMCHQDLQGSEFPHAAELEPPDCGNCHGSVDRTYQESVHGYALARGNPRAPTCANCHGSHDILPSSNPRARTHKVRLPGTCAECHGTAGLLTDRIVKLPQSFAAYAQSVHGRGAERGIATAASCADCHGVHDLKGSVDPRSKINPFNVAATCGQCHPDIQLEYEGSIHGRALNTGVRDSPTCTDCHGEHLILSPHDPEAATCAARQATQTCGPCHDDPVIIAKYNLQGGVVGSYVDSYHGWTTRRGCEETATCVNCHTAHAVLPEEDSTSTIHPANLPQTCGQCHDDATAKFASSYTHETTSMAANPINRIIRDIYIVLIALIIGLMVVHNLMIMNHFMVERRELEESSRFVMRFDRTQIVQHLLLTISFIMLVITGFALRFPEAWWVEGLSSVGMTETVRGDLHRIFAVVMVVTSLYHMWYIFLTNRGRDEFRSIMPAWRDIKELYDNIRYYTFQSRNKAKFGRYDYTQKAEYWALVWGTIVMILTGIILWWPQWAVRILPSWSVSAAQTIHYYEAWLATLAVIVWHFFFVIFHPEEYPMSWTWLTGKMSEESVKRHHPGWYEEIKKSGGVEQAASQKPPSGDRGAPSRTAEVGD